MTRTRAVVAAVVVVTLAVPTYAWWRLGANERHVDRLIETTYDYSGYEDPPNLNFLNHGRRTHATDECEGLGGNWYGFKAASASDPDVNFLAGAEVAAQRFEAEGWTVERWIGGSPDSVLWRVLAHKGNEEVSGSYFDGAISIGAATGPCKKPGIQSTSGSGQQIDNFNEQ